MATKIYSHDGTTRPATKEDLRPGLVLRHGLNVEEGIFFLPAFSDCVVVKVDGDTVHLVRPYVYSHHAGTTAPGVLFGHESFTAQADRLDRFTVVLSSTGEPAVYKLNGPLD